MVATLRSSFPSLIEQRKSSLFKPLLLPGGKRRKAKKPYPSLSFLFHPRPCPVQRRLHSIASLRCITFASLHDIPLLSAYSFQPPLCTPLGKSGSLLSWPHSQPFIPLHSPLHLACSQSRSQVQRGSPFHSQ